MHILIDMSSLFVVILIGNMLLLRLLPTLGNWSLRQKIHLLVLVIPLVSLVLIAGGVVHVVILYRVLSPSRWDPTLDFVFLLLFSCLLLGAVLMGGMRLVLMKRLMQLRELVVDPALQARVDAWTHARGMSPIRVRLCLDARPLALIYGIRRPTALLSTWMLEQLDESELEAVLIHELVHVSRNDYLVNWIAIVLRDAFFYLPTSRIAYRQLRSEKELACDDVVVQTTRQPLALASALTKVWLHIVNVTPTVGASLIQTLVRSDELITDRVNRLLAPLPISDKQQSSLLFSTSLLVCVLLIVTFASVALFIAEVVCWPGILF